MGTVGSKADSTIQAHRHGTAIVAHVCGRVNTESVEREKDAKESLGIEGSTIKAHRQVGAVIVAYGCGRAVTKSVGRGMDA